MGFSWVRRLIRCLVPLWGKGTFDRETPRKQRVVSRQKLQEMMLLQAKEQQGLPATTLNWEEARKRSASEPLEEVRPCQRFEF